MNPVVKQVFHERGNYVMHQGNHDKGLNKQLERQRLYAQKFSRVGDDQQCRKETKPFYHYYFPVGFLLVFFWLIWHIFYA